MTILLRARFAATFAGARGAQFLAPIAAANLLSAADYGTVEFAFAAASIAVTLSTLGTLSLLPFLKLGSSHRGKEAAIALHLGALVAAAAAAVVAGLFHAQAVTALPLSATFFSLLIVQSYWVVSLRAQGAVSGPLLLEASPFVIVCLAGLLARWALPGLELPAVLALLSLAWLLCMLWTAPEWQRLAPLRTTRYEYLETITSSMPLMLGGLLAMLAFTMGRLGAGYLGQAEVVGMYAVLARVAAIPIVAHQFAVTAKFRDLYSTDVADLQRLAIKVSALVTIAALVAIVLLPHISPLLGRAYGSAFSASPAAALILVSQAVLWSGISLNDTIAARHAVLGKIVPWTSAALTLSAAAAGLVIHLQGADVTRLVLGHTAVMFSLFATQSVSMTLQGVKPQRFGWACTGFFAIAVSAAVLMLRFVPPTT